MIVRLHIDRIVVDAGMLSDTDRAAFGTELRETLERELAGGAFDWSSAQSLRRHNDSSGATLNESAATSPGRLAPRVSQAVAASLTPAFPGPVR